MPFVCGACALAFSFFVHADEGPRVAPIAREHYPAFFFVQEDTAARRPVRSNLLVATFVGGRAEVRKVMAAEYIKAKQLADAIFMLEAEHYPDERSEWTQEYRLVDFRSGGAVVLSESRSRDELVHLRCLRSNPDSGEAVILRYGQGTTESSVIRVDLGSLKTTVLRNIPRTDATTGFHGPRVRISPDFKRLAAMVGRERTGRSNRTAYSLRVLDLDTLKTTELDTEVMVEISPISSFGRGNPPFEWITPTAVLYQHILPEKAPVGRWRSYARHVLKSVNVASGAADVWLTKSMRLSMQGGTMRRDWLTQKLEYHDYLVDTQSRKLMARRPSYTISDRSGAYEIRFRGELLKEHPPNPSYAYGYTSPSGDNLAYFVSYHDQRASPAVYAKTADMKQAVQVSRGPFHTTPVGWLEDAAE